MSQTILSINDTLDKILEILPIKGAEYYRLEDKLEAIYIHIKERVVVDKTGISDDLKRRIVDKILKSDVNIDVIPDFIEREIYELILNTLEKKIDL